MGFLSRAKDVGGTIFNFKVGKWLGYDQVKTSFKNLSGIGKEVFTPAQAERTETFEEALERLQLTEEDLKQRQTEFTRLMAIYIAVALLVFMYSVWIVYAYRNFYGFCMGFSLTIYVLSLAFRYHFWIFQIKHKKLGCTLRDWFLDKS
jgi:intracellular multiplication protein IcmV